MTEMPYLKLNRLADAIAAIQFMSQNVRSSQLCEKWAEYVSGDSDKMKTDHWRGVFDEHPSLERLLGDVGFKPKLDIKTPYTQKWLDQALAQLTQLEGK